MISEDKIIETYEYLRKQAQANVIETGLERINYELCEWRVVNNEANRCRDLIITIDISGKRESLVISYNVMKLYVGNEHDINSVADLIMNKIQKELAEFVAGKMSVNIFKNAAISLVGRQ